MEDKHRNRTVLTAVVSVIVLIAVLAGGMMLLSGKAHKDATNAARSVNLL